MTIPSPSDTWLDGEDQIPDAADLNSQWRDSMNILIGWTRPIFEGYHTTTATTANSGVWTPIPLNVEVTKRLTTHSANSAVVTLPETGWYTGICKISWGAAGNVLGQRRSSLRKNGTTIMTDTISDSTPYFVDIQIPQETPFRAFFTAGDTVEMMAYQNSGLNWNIYATGAGTIEFASYFGIWWEGKL